MIRGTLPVKYVDERVLIIVKWGCSRTLSGSNAGPHTREVISWIEYSLHSTQKLFRSV